MKPGGVGQRIVDDGPSDPNAGGLKNPSNREWPSIKERQPAGNAQLAIDIMVTAA